MNWKNVNLTDSYERDQNILEPYSFDTLLLECYCNIKSSEVSEQRIREQFETVLKAKVREAREIFNDNLSNITKKVKKDNL